MPVDFRRVCLLQLNHRSERDKAVRQRLDFDQLRSHLFSLTILVDLLTLSGDLHSSDWQFLSGSLLISSLDAPFSFPSFSFCRCIPGTGQAQARMKPMLVNDCNGAFLLLKRLFSGTSFLRVPGVREPFSGLFPRKEFPISI